MKIRREFGTYLIECYIPCMFLVVVAWFSFLVPEGQFVGRVLLTLVPLIALTSFSNAYKGSLASVPYATAMDTFIGVSLCIIFLSLVYVILCNARAAKKGEEVCMFVCSWLTYVCFMRVKFWREKSHGIFH